jgi:hypothetical protein
MAEELGRIIQLPKVEDVRGNLTFIEENRHIPFEIKRVYYLYDVPGGESRGGHAHKQLQQFIIAATGSFDVILDEPYPAVTDYDKKTNAAEFITNFLVNDYYYYY